MFIITCTEYSYMQKKKNRLVHVELIFLQIYANLFGNTPASLYYIPLL